VFSDTQNNRSYKMAHLYRTPLSPLAAAIIASVGLSTTAFAQQGKTALEEIIVTAQR
jgi:hypothetical protein